MQSQLASGLKTTRSILTSSLRLKSDSTDLKSKFYPNTSFGIKERSIKPDSKEPVKPLLTPFPPFPDGKNPKTGEIGGPAGPEPTVFGDWQRKGRVTDF